MIYTRRTQNWELVSRDEKMNVRFVGQAINRIYAVLLVNLFTKSSLKMFSRLQYPYF